MRNLASRGWPGPWAARRDIPAKTASARQRRAGRERQAAPGLFDEPRRTADAADAVRGVSTVRYDTILTWDAFDAWLARIEAAELVALDTETTSLDEMRAADRRHQLQRDARRGRLHPAGATPTPTRPSSCRSTRCWPASSPGWKTRRKHKLGQHIKYDRHVFANHGIEVQGYAHDTMLQSYVLEVHKPHGLASLAERHLGRSGISYEDLCGKGAHQIPFRPGGRGQGGRVLLRRLRPDAGCAPGAVAAAGRPTTSCAFIYELEIASSEALYRIERNGVLIDAPTLAAQSHELGQRIVAAGERGLRDSPASPST